jgi:hypothetical protein
MAIAATLVEAPEVAATPMSYWRTVGWRLGRDRATLVAGVLAVIVLRGAGAVPRYDRPPIDPCACAGRRVSTCSGPTSGAATC